MIACIQGHLVLHDLANSARVCFAWFEHSTYALRERRIVLDTADRHRIGLFLRSIVRTTAPLLSPASTSRLLSLTF